MHVCVCVCVCVRDRERQSEGRGMETRKNPQFPPLTGKNNLTVIKLGYSPNWRGGCIVWLPEGYWHVSGDISIYLSRENSALASGEKKPGMLLNTLQVEGQPYNKE